MLLPSERAAPHMRHTLDKTLRRCGPIQDLLRVGPNKPLGYLPLDTIITICGLSPYAIKQDMEARGLKTKFFTKTMCSISSGALFVWDEDALRKILETHSGVLNHCGWPSEPEEFVTKVAIDTAEDGELYKVVGKCFADARFTGAE